MSVASHVAHGSMDHGQCLHRYEAAELTLYKSNECRSDVVRRNLCFALVHTRRMITVDDRRKTHPRHPCTCHPCHPCHPCHASINPLLRISPHIHTDTVFFFLLGFFFSPFGLLFSNLFINLGPFVFVFRLLRRSPTGWSDRQVSVSCYRYHYYPGTAGCVRYLELHKPLASGGRQGNAYEPQATGHRGEWRGSRFIWIHGGEVRQVLSGRLDSGTNHWITGSLTRLLMP